MKIKVNTSVKDGIVADLKKIFKNHIGIKNAITSEELFFRVTRTHANDVDYYEREYKWNLIKRILGKLRKEGELFVIMGASYHYVLNSEDELDAYKSKIDSTVKGLNAMKKKAEAWVDSEELKEMRDGKMKKVLRRIGA